MSQRLTDVGDGSVGSDGTMHAAGLTGVSDSAGRSAGRMVTEDTVLTGSAVFFGGALGGAVYVHMFGNNGGNVGVSAFSHDSSSFGRMVRSSLCHVMQQSGRFNQAGLQSVTGVIQFPCQKNGKLLLINSLTETCSSS